MTDTTAVYLRVSTKEQEVASQQREVRRWLDGHGVSVTDEHWYVDAGFSGRTLDRPALKRLNSAIFRGDIKRVVVYRLDRLARSIRDGVNLIHDWLEQGVHLVFVTMELDLRGTVGQIVATLLLGLAQMEREATRERQQAGIEAARERQREAQDMAQAGRSVTQIVSQLRVRATARHTAADVVCQMLAAGEHVWWGTAAAQRPGRPPVCNASRIIELLGRGLTAQEVCRSLGISRRTMERHLRSRGGMRRVRRELQDRAADDVSSLPPPPP